MPLKRLLNTLNRRTVCCLADNGACISLSDASALSRAERIPPRSNIKPGRIAEGAGTGSGWRERTEGAAEVSLLRRTRTPHSTANPRALPVFFSSGLSTACLALCVPLLWWLLLLNTPTGSEPDECFSLLLCNRFKGKRVKQGETGGW